MNKNSTAAHGMRESLRNLFPNGVTNGGSYSVYSQPRRSQGLLSKDHSQTTDENLDLFSRNRRISSYETDSSSDASVRANASAKLGKNSPLDDLLFSTDGGKHDYDWLLTPPGTPLFTSTETNESRPAGSMPAMPSLARSSSVSKISRLSLSQPEIANPTPKPPRSSSLARSTISSFSSKSSSILNSSSVSRPSSPAPRSSSTARSVTPTPRAPVSRNSAPSKPRTVPSPSPSSVPDRPRVSQNSRPSTPTGRYHVSVSQNPLPSRSLSRSSTPTRRVTGSAPSNVLASARASTNGRVSVPSSRPSSPSPRPKLVIPPEYSISTPPNLRTTLPERPLSAGRSRPTPSSAKVLPEITSPSPRRLSSPIITRGRQVDPPIKTRVGVGAPSQFELPDRSRRVAVSSEPGSRRLTKTTPNSFDVGTFAKITARKSIDMGSRPAGGRVLSNATLFPHSVRVSGTRGHPLTSSIASESSGNGGSAYEEYGRSQIGNVSAKLTNFDIYESSRYDTMLLKEDTKNTNWLHSIDDRSDQESVFDCGFGSLPEPFT